MSLVVGRFRGYMYKDDLRNEIMKTGEFYPRKHFFIRVKYLDNPLAENIYYVFGFYSNKLLYSKKIENTYNSMLDDESMAIKLTNIIKERLIKGGHKAEVACVQTTMSCLNV